MNPPCRHLLLVLGDQLDIDSSVFDGLDPALDAVLMVEAFEESTHVWSHKARTALFLSAMRHFAGQLRQRGITVHYRALEHEGDPTLADGLRAAALQGHAQAWQAAWQELDATVLAAALTQLQSHGALRLTLCSEQAAHTYEAQPQAWHQRLLRPFRKTPAHAALQALITP